MRAFLILIGCMAVIQLAESQPSYERTPEEEESLAVYKSLARTSLAYRAAAGERMLAEINHYSDRLHLPTPHPIRYSDLDGIRISPPWFNRVGDTNTGLSSFQKMRTVKFAAGGNLETTNMCFTCRDGKLAYVLRVDQQGMSYRPSCYDDNPVLINDAQAYQIATQSLAAIDEDLAKLEKIHPHRVWRWRCPNNTNSTSDLAHFFFVGWGEGENPPVCVTIDGRTGKLLGIDMQDVSFSRRPLLIITNAIELNNIPDPPAKQLLQPQIPSSTNQVSK